MKQALQEDCNACFFRKNSKNDRISFEKTLQ